MDTNIHTYTVSKQLEHILPHYNSISRLPFIDNNLKTIPPYQAFHTGFAVRRIHKWPSAGVTSAIFHICFKAISGP